MGEGEGIEGGGIKTSKQRKRRRVGAASEGAGALLALARWPVKRGQSGGRTDHGQPANQVLRKSKTSRESMRSLPL